MDAYDCQYHLLSHCTIHAAASSKEGFKQLKDVLTPPVVLNPNLSSNNLPIPIKFPSSCQQLTAG